MQITLTSSDAQSFSVDRELLKHSGTIETLIVNINLDDADTPPMPISLPNVDDGILKLVIEWLKQHKDEPVKEAAIDPNDEIIVSVRDKQFLKVYQ